jgi:hypothetical protein
MKRKTSVTSARPPLKLVDCFVSDDTIAALESLLERARAGEIIGLAYAAMARERRFVADTAGEANRNPTYTLGMVRALDELVVSRTNIRR